MAKAKINHQLLKELTEASGIPGFEDEIRPIVQKELKKTCKSVKIDPMGNVIGHRPGSGRNKLKIMLAGHMDEIGFIVNYVDDNGFLRIVPLGGFDPRTLMSQRVWVVTQKGEKFHGLLNLGTKPIHIASPEELKKPAQVTDYYVDLGMPAEKAKKKFDIGDFVTMNRQYMILDDCVSNKCMDNRIGVYLMLEASKLTKNTKNDFYFVGTVQEEVGLRGARTSANAIQPDIAIALDVTITADIAGTEPHQQVSKLRSGIGIKISDSASISDRKLVKEFKALAEKNKINYQMEILPRGGTDAGAMQASGGGCRVITLSVPCRYVHSVNEMCSIDDINAGVELLATWMNNY
jgi:putative aminopeptidase FrvX